MNIPNKIWAIADQGVSSTGNFLQIFLLAKYMNPFDFGIVILCVSILQFLEGLLSTITSAPLNVLGAKLENDEYDAFFKSISIIQLALSLICFIIAFSVGYILFIYSKEFEWVMMFSLVVPIYIWYEYSRRSVYAYGTSASKAFFYSFIRYFIFFSILFSGFFIKETISIYLVFTSMALASLIASLSRILQIFKYIFKSDLSMLMDKLKNTWNKVWEFGRWFVGTSFVNMFGNGGYVWVITIILGVESLGIYQAAIQLVKIMNPFNQIVINFLPAQASRAYSSDGARGLLSVMKINYLFFSLPVIFISTILITMPNQVISFMYGNEKYNEKGLDIVIMLATFSFILNFSVNFFQIIFLANDNTKALFLNSILGSIILVFIGIPLVYFTGYMGAPSAQILASISTLFFLFYMYKK